MAVGITPDAKTPDAIIAAITKLNDKAHGSIRVSTSGRGAGVTLGVGVYLNGTYVGGGSHETGTSGYKDFNWDTWCNY